MTLVEGELARPRDALGTFGIYVHIPFCSHRCWYCDFNAYAGLDEIADDYMAALVADAEAALSAPADAELDPRPTVTSIFIGGGTPSLVRASWIVELLEALRSSWPVAAGAEITIECNPESVEDDKLATYRQAGVNRVSVGVQSLEASSLRALGRVHDSRRALAALDSALAAGFDSVSADLIFGVPGESDRSWRSSVEGVLARGVGHLSSYALTYEEGTPLHAWRRLGKVTPVPDDDVVRRWETVDALAAGAGLERYETSNWARPGHDSIHNGLYWACGEYLGLGAGAHSHLATSSGARRSWTLRAPARYASEVTGGRRPVSSSEVIGASERAAEVMLLGLRRTAGVSADDFRRLCGRDLDEAFGPAIASATDDGLLMHDGQGVRLTPRGTMLADEVLRRFLADGAERYAGTRDR